jgi:conjugal transfer mating pair stabilization protein TraN
MMHSFSAVLCLALVSASASAQKDVRDDAKAFAQDLADVSTNLADTDAAAVDNLTGYNGANSPETQYLDNPSALEAARIPAARTNEASVLVIDGDAIRPRVPDALIDETIERGEIINEDPSIYVQGVDPSGSTGQCVELPPTTTSPGNFEATCNSGSQITDEVRSCSIPLVGSVETETTTVYDYWAAPDNTYGAPFVRYGQFTAGVNNGTCKVMPETIGGCAGSRAVGLNPNKFCGDYTLRHYQCTAAIGPETPGTFIMPITGHWYYATSTATVETVVTERNESLCTPLETDSDCSLIGGEICVDSDPVTRMIGNTAVTRPCWEWKRDYQCTAITQGNDCTDLDNNPACQYQRTECLDDPQQGACKVEERIYICPIPGSVAAEKQFVCGGDLYCIGGECEAVTREASDEFKDAVVGLEALAQANREFDEVDYKLFEGNPMSCHKPIFGLVNCCAGKVSGLIPTAAGFAALAGGPTAIAGLATPFLTLFLCDASEKELDVRERMGLCHTLGSYCSSKILGICTTKRRTSCCFLSKLTRVLQEQGREQLSKSWGTPKEPECSGFTIDEFSALDLSIMDFTEVYQEFIDAAKLPDEADTMTDIQEKIRAYYSRGGP